VTLLFDGLLIAHMHVNWLAPVKVRRTLIGGSKKMVVYNQLEAGEEVKVYDKGVTINNGPENLYRIVDGYRMGDMWAPHFDRTEPLRTEVLEFIECMEQGKRPSADGQAGLRLVRVLEAATSSMMQRGRPVELDAGRGPT
jgi:predicted dehydrogenase